MKQRNIDITESAISNAIDICDSTANFGRGLAIGGVISSAIWAGGLTAVFNAVGIDSLTPYMQGLMTFGAIGFAGFGIGVNQCHAEESQEMRSVRDSLSGIDTSQTPISLSL